MKMRWSRRALVLALLITPWCWTPLHAQGSCKQTPTLSGPSPVTRASGTATYTVGNLCKTYTVQGWSFTDGSTTVSRGSSGAITWPGKMVQSGTVQVTVIQGGRTYPLSKSVAVIPRTTGFAFTAKPATKYANNTFTCTTPSGTLSLAVPDTPQPGIEIGLAISCLRYSFMFTQISDGGPNQGYWYVLSTSDSAPGVVPTDTTFAWTMSPQLDDPSSEFYKAQCGSGGFISGAQLQANTVAHESGSLNSHYSRYVAAQNDPAKNVGTALEAVVGPPSDTPANFQSRAQAVGDARQAQIVSLSQQEPCGASDLSKDESCTSYGNVNFQPYQSCGNCQSDPDCSSQPAPYNQCVNGRCGNASCPPAPPPSSVCIPSGSVDDILGNTNCCSGMSVPGSGCCIYQADWGASWASCSQICG